MSKKKDEYVEVPVPLDTIVFYEIGKPCLDINLMQAEDFNEKYVKERDDKDGHAFYRLRGEYLARRINFLKSHTYLHQGKKMVLMGVYWILENIETKERQIITEKDFLKTYVCKSDKGTYLHPMQVLKTSDLNEKR